MDGFEKLLREGDKIHAKLLREFERETERRKNDLDSIFSSASKSQFPPFGFIPNPPLTSADDARFAEKVRLWRESQSSKEESLRQGAGSNQIDDAQHVGSASLVHLDDSLRSLVTYTYGPLHTQLLGDLDSITCGQGNDFPLGLVTVPLAHQSTGTERVLRILDSEFAGCLLCDPMGMGKSFTALNAALRTRDRLLPRCGFILVVCPASCVMQWYSEVQKHYMKKTRPRCIILDDKRCSPLQLLKFDIVICSEGFLKQRAREAEEYKVWFILKDFISAEALKAKGIRSYKTRQNLVLHSPIYEKSDKMIPVVIVDESHHAKRLDSQLNESIQSLKYHHAILLTGTPIYNTWKDICGQLALLPGGRAFRTNTNGFCDIAGDTMNDPLSPASLFMMRLLVGVVVARPLTVITLPKMTTHQVAVDFTGAWSTLILIDDEVQSGRKLLKRAAHPTNHLRREQFKRRAFGHLTKAQQYAACPAILKAPERFTLSTLLADKIQRAFEKFLAKKGMDLQTSMDDLPRDIFEEFRVFARDDTSPRDDSEESLFLENRDSFAGDNVDEEVMAAIGAHESHEEGFIYADDENDDTYDPEKGDVELVDAILTEESEDENGERRVHHARRKTRADAGFTNQWKNKLQAFPDMEIFSPRVKAIMETTRKIATEYPGEGIVVMSSSVLFLDVIQEALKRSSKVDDALRFEVSEYNATLDIDQRAKTIVRFNEAGNKTKALLASFGVGRVGVNMHGASHLIFAAPFLTPEEKRQAQGQVHRIPQKREVHIWEVVADSSTIDMYMLEKTVEKTRVDSRLETRIIRKDNEVIVPAMEPDSHALEQFLLNAH